VVFFRPAALTIFAVMETIPKTDCEKVGFVRKTHGVQGEVVLEFEAHYEYSVEEAVRFFVELDGLLVPFFLKEDGFRFKTANTAIVTFDGVDSENYAKRLVGMSVFLYRAEIIQTNHDPIQSRFLNYELIDKKLGKLGRITHIDDFAGNIVLTVDYHENELLIPFNEDFLTELNDEQKIIIMQLPEGLVE
jgi:16S rRNA processing protein RimM